MNKSGLKPVGCAILCVPYDPETAHSIIEVPEHVKQALLMQDMRATVLEIGPNCWVDEPPRAKVGDRVLISKFSGAIFKGPLDGELYRIINDNDIFCVIESDAWDKVIIQNPLAKQKQIERTTSAGRMAVPGR